VDEKTKSRESLFEHLFLRYGAGSRMFSPITRWRHFNVVAWTAIGLGIIGWGVLAWALHSQFPSE
jgi:hypothetical protein